MMGEIGGEWKLLRYEMWRVNVKWEKEREFMMFLLLFDAMIMLKQSVRFAEKFEPLKYH